MAKYKQIRNSRGQLVNTARIVKSTPPLATKPTASKPQNMLAECKKKLFALYGMIKDVENASKPQKP